MDFVGSTAAIHHPSSPSNTSARKSISLLPNFHSCTSSSTTIIDTKNSIPAYASPKSIRQLRDSISITNTTTSNNGTVTVNSPSKTAVVTPVKTNSFPKISIFDEDHSLEETGRRLSWKGQLSSKTKAPSPLSIFPESATEMLQVATSPTKGRRFSENTPFFFQSVSEKDDDSYIPGCMYSPKRRSITKPFEVDVSSPTNCTTSTTSFADIKTRKRGSTLPIAYQPKVHKIIPQKAVFEIIFNRDLFVEVSEFLEWKDLLSLTHSCAALFDMGCTHSFVWKHKLLSTHKLLNSKQDRIEESIREKSNIASQYCHFETFRDVYDSLSVAAENKSTKCFEQLFEILHIEGTQYSRKSRMECNGKWKLVGQLLSKEEDGQGKKISMSELQTTLFPFPSPSYPLPDDSELNQFQSPITTISMAQLIEKTTSIYGENINFPLDWKGIVEYFYSAESFYDACLADFTKIKKIYEYFHLTFKPYPELLIMHSHYLNYNENAKPSVFTSPVRAFVGWSFFYGKFLEVNMDLISHRENILQERSYLEGVVLPFIFKKLERDNSN